MTRAPVLLPANQPPDRFYRGGPRIAAFRGERGAPASGDHVPEDWVASVTTQAGTTSIGLTTLPATPAGEAQLLRSAIAADPLGWLGPAHVEAFGTDPRLLVKLLDPGQRLPVHAHPDDAWAAAHLGHRHGKAEAWCILEPGEVFLALRESVTAERLLELVGSQDTGTLLSLLHRRDVVAGDTVYVPPGVLHAIGEGVMLAEVQQPADLSILLEWRGFELDGATDGHLGVGFDEAFGALELTARSGADVDALITRAATNGPLLPADAAPYFRAERDTFSGGMRLEKGYAVLVVTEGALDLAFVGRRLALRAGDTVLVPYAAGPLELTGSATVLVFRPPTPGRDAMSTGRWIITDGARWFFDAGADSLDFTSGPDSEVRHWLAERFERLPLAEIGERELVDALGLRAAIGRLAAARADGVAPAPDDVDTLNLFAATPDVPPVLTGGRRQAGAGNIRVGQALSSLARDAVTMLAAEADGADRIRRCDAEDCRIVFHDESRTGSRRWCSMARCGNRAKVRAFRARSA